MGSSRIQVTTMIFGVGLAALHGLSFATEVNVEAVYRDAISAYQAGDGDSMRVATDQLLTVRPNAPRVLYFQAAADALAGRDDEAIDTLGRLAAMGLFLPAADEPAFASIEKHPGFVAVTSQFVDNRQPVGTAETVLTIDDGHFIPEDVVFDSQTGRYLIGSVRQRRIVAIGADGSTADLVAPGADGLMSVMGMTLDEANRRLYVASTGATEAPETPSHRIGRTGIYEFDVDSGELLGQFLLPEVDKPRWLGDLVLSGDRLYASDSLTGEIWCFLLADGAWHNLVAAGQLVSPQGLALDAAGDALYIADYSRGLYRLELKSGALSLISAPESVNTHGTDGLYRSGSRLIAIQNGHQPHRIAQFNLSADGLSIESADILAAGLEQFDDPTLGYIRNGALTFVANSHWPSFAADKSLPPIEEMTGPIIMRVELR